MSLQQHSWLDMFLVQPLNKLLNIADGWLAGGRTEICIIQSASLVLLTFLRRILSEVCRSLKTSLTVCSVLESRPGSLC